MPPSTSFLVTALQHHPQRIKCSLSDLFSFRKPISVVFFYRKAIPIDLIVHTLRTVLSDFPIFAGVLVKCANELYIDCNNQGVQVTIAYEKGSLLPSPSDLQKLDLNKFVDEIHPVKALKHRKPVLFIKLTYYEEGMAIGYCWHHSIGDMETFMNFLKALSASAQGKPYQPALIPHDRTAYLKHWLEEKKITGGPKKSPSKLKLLNFFDLCRLAKQFCSTKQIVSLHFAETEIETLRDTISEKAGQKLSRNDVLCAYLLDIVTRCRSDRKGSFHLSFILNIRSRLGMPSNLSGNYVDLLSLTTNRPDAVELFATKIHGAVKSYLDEHFQHEETEDFVQRSGGIKRIGRMAPEKMLPQHKNLTITNWSNFGVYSIDFGVSTPHLFLPIGRTPFPWVSCIVEGFGNKGLLVTLALPSKVAKRLTTPEMLKQIHQYRAGIPNKALTELKEPALLH